MDNRIADIPALLHEVAARRDARLQRRGATMPSTTSDRLQDAVASAFPVEAALSAAALKRDRMFNGQTPVLPALIAAALAERVLPPQTEAMPSARLQQIWTFLQLRWRLAGVPGHFAAAAAAAVIIGFAVAQFSRPVRHDHAAQLPQLTEHRPQTGPVGAELPAQDWLTSQENGILGASSRQLTLRVSRIELASLRPSLLSVEQAMLANRFESDGGLPLDLPIRQIFIDGEAAATP